MNYFFKILLFFILSVAMAVGLNAQCPGPAQRQALINLQKANVAETTRAGQIPLTDTCGNQRYAQYVEISLTQINYIPTTTGNANNLSEFVVSSVDTGLYYIDWQGRAIRFSGTGGGGTCDVDWLEIGPGTCPDNINDSIFKYKYVAIGARYVWPTAELLVSDSSAVQVTILSGNRNSRLGFYDNVNQVSSTIDQSGAQTIWYFEPTGEMRWTTAGGGTVQAPGAPFVNQFAINPADAPLPTVQAHLYLNTRSDTNTVENFLYTDPVGKFRSRPIDSLVQIVVDSIQADTTLQRNWYTHNGVTTDLGRVAFVKRSAWWRGLDSIGFMRFSMRPDLFDGPQLTIWQDSIDIDSDTIAWRSTYHPALQFHNLEAETTYFNADSLKVVGLGQFANFPNLNYDGTEKGFYYYPDEDGVIIINGNGSSGNYSFANMRGSDYIIQAISDDVKSTISGDPEDFSIIVNSDVSTHDNIGISIDNFNDNVLVSANMIGVDTNRNVIQYIGEGVNASIGYIGRRSFGIRTYMIDSGNLDEPFDWLQSYLPNDTTENAISFYNRAYYWKNEHPTGAAGDTLLHFWAATGPGGEAGLDPGFITLDQVCAHCAESVVNWYTSNGTTTDNTRIADVQETATWRSDNVTSDGIVPFRFELAGGGANEPENMVWMFPNGDSAVIQQGDQEIFLFTNSAWVLKADLAASVQADSFSFNPNLGGNAFRIGRYNVMTQNSDAAPTHRDAIEYNSITGTSQTEIFLDGSSAVWVLPTNSVQNFKIHIAAICSSAGNGVGISTGEAYSGWFLGGIKRVTNTTSLVGSVQADATAQADAGMSTSVVTIDADDTDESLRIRFTPPSTAGSTTVIQVTATIEITQTSY